MMSPQRNIHKYTCTTPDRKIHNPFVHILIDRQRHSSLLDVQQFWAADCDNDNYLVVAAVRERPAVSKQRSQRFHTKYINLKKLNEIGDKEKYHIGVSNRFAALEDLAAEVEVNSTLGMIRENINISAKESLGYFELKKRKPWFYK
jgi:hypothetical protein